MSIDTETLIYEDEIKKASKVLRALNHPLRKKIVLLLERYKELTVTEIYLKMRIEQSIASHHIGILREAGVLANERKGKTVRYFIDGKRLAQVNILAAKLADYKPQQNN